MADGMSVRVIARVRPMNNMELQRGEHQCVDVDPQRPSCMQLDMPGPGGRVQTKDFNFDCCIPTNASQEQFFDGTGVVDLLDSALDGCDGATFEQRASYMLYVLGMQRLYLRMVRQAQAKHLVCPVWTKK